jgi:LysM repeat protein
VVLALLLGLGIGIGLSRMLFDGKKDKPDGVTINLTERPTAPPTATPRGGIVPVLPPTVTFTPTQAITLSFATITPMPPTATETLPPTPCYQTAKQGDTISDLAYRCGHVSMDVVPLILEANDMKSPQELQVGQTLEIPWPTATPGGEPTQPPASDAGTGGGGDETPETSTSEIQYNEFGTPDMMAKYENVAATLRPGMAWYTVKTGDTILSISFEFDTTLEVLSQINPEVPFLNCEFGAASGGPNCVVMLSEGQQIRVPVPLPTPTLSPTPVGTLTPTPTATATFNAPYVLGPDDKTHFPSDQIVTLRWGGTGTLGANERYAVHVRDMEEDMDYLALVQDTAYQLPGGWQPSDGHRHTFMWTVSVAQIDAQNNVLGEDHQSLPRNFTWDSR